MERFRVQGGARLAGSVTVPGAKNSALKLMAAALLTEGESHLGNVPRILDVQIMADLLRRLGAAVELEWSGPGGHHGTVHIASPERPGHLVDEELARRMRASISLLGPLLARCGRVRIPLPGGDAIGARGLDMHMAGLVRLGAEVTSERGFLVVEAPGGLRGRPVTLAFPSVGATETLLMTAATARGATVIENAAREPEIVDLCTLLEEMGAKVGGAGTPTIEVQGVERLSPVAYETVPDRIVAGTYAVGAAMTRGDVTVRQARAEHLQIALEKLADSGAEVAVAPDGFRVRMDRRPRAVDVATLPYPGFATDLQPQFAALNAVAEGSAMITENVFEARFVFLQELTRMGAQITMDGHHAVVRGTDRLTGTTVRASDVRAGAGLLLAGLVARGETTVTEIHHIDRGYAGLLEHLRELGAPISRVAG